MRNAQHLSQRQRTKFGKTIRIYRKTYSMDQAMLAGRLGISVPMLSLFETGKREPKLATALRLGDIFGIHVHDFLR